MSRLYLLYDGSDAAVEGALSALPRVEVMLAAGSLAQAEEAADYAAYLARADNHGAWLGRPGNYELMIKQGAGRYAEGGWPACLLGLYKGCCWRTGINAATHGTDSCIAPLSPLAFPPTHPAAYGATRALNVAREDGAAWLVSIDPDELLRPGGDAAFSLAPELCGAPAHVPSIRFINLEGVPEAGGIANPFEQVTLFRGHRHMAPADAAAWRTVFKQGHNQIWLNLYSNGKSAVRVDAPGVHQGGPHLFVGPANPRWAGTEEAHDSRWHLRSLWSQATRCPH